MEDYKKKYEEALENLKRIKTANKDNNELVNFIEYKYPELKESPSEGYIERYKYNVSKTTSSQYDMMSPRTISYVITFKNPSQLDYFTLDLLDPFIIVEYMGTYMEVHAVYRYRSNTALHEYVQPNVAVILPWTVPSAIRLTVSTSDLRRTAPSSALT